MKGRFISACFIASAWACADATGPATLVTIPASSLAFQTGVVEEAVASGPALRVSDQHNRPVSGVEVSFAVTKGGGHLSAATAVTDENGVAAVGWILGRKFVANEVTATVAGSVPVTFTALAIAPDTGIVAFDLIDPANDTLVRDETTLAPAIDLIALRGVFRRDSLVLTATFGSPVTSNFDSPNFLRGFIEFDIDDDANTGGFFQSSAYGAAAGMGADFRLNFYGPDAGLVPAATPFSVPMHFNGSTVVWAIPLKLLANDDGEFRLQGVLGTMDQATDIFPNTGQITVRR